MSYVFYVFVFSLPIFMTFCCRRNEKKQLLAIFGLEECVRIMKNTVNRVHTPMIEASRSNNRLQQDFGELTRRTHRGSPIG